MKVSIIVMILLQTDQLLLSSFGYLVLRFLDADDILEAEKQLDNLDDVDDVDDAAKAVVLAAKAREKAAEPAEG